MEQAVQKFNYSIGLKHGTSNWSTAMTATELKPVLSPFESWQKVLIVMVIGVCMVLTITGNILVLMSFIVDRTLRQPSNYFIASLATTDVLIGAVLMPIDCVYILLGYWEFDPLLCELWLSVDFTLCTASHFTVLLITVDRFCSVKIAVKYRTWCTKNKVIRMVVLAWIIPVLLFFPSIFGFVGYSNQQPLQCFPDLSHRTVQIVGYFWTTLIVLLVLYSGIYKVVYEIQKKSEAKQRKMQLMVAGTVGTALAAISSSSLQQTMLIRAAQHTHDPPPQSTVVAMVDDVDDDDVDDDDDDDEDDDDDYDDVNDDVAEPTVEKSSLDTIMGGGERGGSLCYKRERRSRGCINWTVIKRFKWPKKSCQVTKSKSKDRSRKSFRTISFILGAFVMCWIPYHVLVLIRFFCGKAMYTNERLYQFTYFLCYVNSLINPFCYALANRRFKKTLTRLVKGDFHTS